MAKRKMFFALAINILLVMLELIGCYLSIRRHGGRAFLFYTENSNYFALIVSLIFVVAGTFSLVFERKIPQCIIVLRYMATTCLLITFVVVCFILIPMFPTTTKFMLFEDSNLYQHLLCPILSTFSFFTFESGMQLNKKHLILGVLPTIVYGVIMVALNVANYVKGPYPFFCVYDLYWGSCVLFMSLIVFVTIIISSGVFLIFNRKNHFVYKENEDKNQLYVNKN